jgi:dienelactone hydrolase
MRFTAETTADGVSQRSFALDDIPGVLWQPAGQTAGKNTGLVLLAHGGGQHKLGPAVLGRARLCAAAGLVAAAIDAPGFGDRPRTAADEQFLTQFRRLTAAGEPAAGLVFRYNAGVAARAVPDWQAVLSALLELDDVGPDAPVGYWGTSLGGGIGVPLVAADQRIRAAVLGLVGRDTLAEAAARITVPVQFLMQWDDELVPRDDALALFDAFASAEKTLHANPGRHAEVPFSEHEAAASFLARQLTAAAAG